METFRSYRFFFLLRLIGIILGEIVCLTVSYGRRSPHPYNISYHDSVVMEETSRLFSEAVNIENITNSNLSVFVSIKYPKGWRPISKNNFLKVGLNPHQQKAITIGMLQSQTGKAGMDSVQLKIWDSRHSDTEYYAIRVVVKPRLDYMINPIDQQQYITDSMPKSAIVKLRIKNIGNVEDLYIISCDNDFFKIKSKMSISLQPGEDTLVMLSAPFTKRKWSRLNTEDIFVRYNGLKCGRENITCYQISRPVSQIRQQVNPGNIMPLTIGGGLLSLGDNISYFGNLETHFGLGQHQFSFSYHSKQFGSQAQSFQPNAFNFYYSFKGFQLEAGQIRGPQNFYTNGQGVALTYRTNRGLISVGGLKYQDLPVDVRYKNDNVFGRVEYKINKILVSHRFESNLNPFTNINSYLLNNDIIIIGNKKMDLGVHFGGGYDEWLPTASTPGGKHYGMAVGYNFVYCSAKININSSINYHSTDFPGIYKGQEDQRHELVYNIKKIGIGLSYFSNIVTQTSLLDTVYRSDYLTSNNTKYGILLIKNGAKFNGSFRSGIVHQEGAVIGFPDGEFADIEILWKIDPKTTLSAATNNAFQMADDGNINYATNSYMYYNSRIVGFNANYNRFPLFSADKVLVKYNETVNVGPSVNFGLFRQTFTGSVRVSVAKTLNEDLLRPGIGWQLMYRSKNGNIDFSANGYYPLHDPSHTELPLSETRYGAIGINKRFNFDLGKSKLYRLSVTLYEDTNHNGQRESGERLLKHALVLIDDHSLVTDMNGTAKYQRIKAGEYKIDFSNSTNNGLLPINGLVQSVDIQENTDIDMPFEMGNLLKGNIKIYRDTLSSLVLTPEGFKIIITDTSGRFYNALTDSRGDFKIYVPKGMYNVSLNPAAFLSNDFKPEHMSYPVDLRVKATTFVQFTIKQKKREIRYLDVNKKK